MKKNDYLKLAAEWFENGDEDLEYAKVGLQETEFYAKICFHCQQAAEKYLKGFLISKGVKPEPIHDLVRLLKQISKIDKKFNELAKLVTFLNKFAVEARYPEEWPPLISKTEARVSIEYSKKVGDFVKKNLAG